ncbi:MAG TPA: hypothetical protein VF526_10555 [Solirubrobacteraceae bacterium]
MATDRFLIRRGGLARLAVASVLALAVIGTLFVSEAQAARVLPLPRVTAETYEVDFQGRPAVVLQTLLVRRLHGKLTVTCNRCQRYTDHKLVASRPSRTSKRYRHADWILHSRRAVKIKVTRRGWIGRYLLLTAQRRKSRLRLGYKASGCLSRASRQIRCPRGVPKPRPPIIVVPIPVSPPTGISPSDRPTSPATAVGVIYAIKPNGELMWYRHLGRENGSFKWAATTKVGQGWGQFTRIAAPG